MGIDWNVQVATWSSHNRYPGVFRTLQSRIREKAGPGLGQGRLKILSFGCSTGSELSSLRSYFPEAFIYGCDVNQRVLHSASDNLLMDEALLFDSTPDNIQKHGPFDVILAMSVLCRFPESRSRDLIDLSSTYSFKTFECVVQILSDNLRDDGILCLYNTNYDFNQCHAAAKFRAVRSPFISDNGFVDKFNEEGKRLTWCEQIGPYYVHRLRHFTNSASDIDFTDSIFEKSGQNRSDYFVSGGFSTFNDRACPPAFYRFGPDLNLCAQKYLIATALGYWSGESEGSEHIMRAWHRTTSSGLIECQVGWVVPSSYTNILTLSAAPAVCHSRPIDQAQRQTRTATIGGWIKTLFASSG